MAMKPGMSGDALGQAIYDAVKTGEFTAAQLTALKNFATALVSYMQANTLVTLDPALFTATAPPGGGPVVLTSGYGSVS